MSTRQLRRLQQRHESEIVKKEKEQEEEEEESDEPTTPFKTKASLFSNLTALESEENNVESDEEAEKHEFQGEPIDPKPPPIPVSEKSKKSKKKKSKLIKKPEEKLVHRAGGDDIEKVLKQLDINDKKNDCSHDSRAQNFDESYERICAVLRIQGNYLKVANEMRNLFGRTAVNNNQDTGGVYDQEARLQEARLQEGQESEQDAIATLETVLKNSHPPGKGLSELFLRRNFFIQGKADWSRGYVTRKLTMEVVSEESDGTVEFRYVHSPSYQMMQKSFHEGVEMGIPQHLMDLLALSPDHISLLIQVSRIVKDLGNHALSSDLLERALFFLGKAATSYFSAKLTQGKARLNFARPENRELWLAGYLYIKSLMMKGTYRTALEWAKLLLSLDPKEDPYCIRLLIHHLCLRAQQYKWFCDFYETGIYGSSRAGNITPISQNFFPHTEPSLALAALHMGDLVKARKVITETMKKLPWLFKCLFTELQLEAPPTFTDIVPWSNLDILFTKIYLSQTKDLWSKNKVEITPLLMEIGHNLKKSVIKQHYISRGLTSDVLRFVYLDNSAELMSLVPRERLLPSNNSDADPIPPDENIFSYEAQRTVLEGSSRVRPGWLVIGRWNPSQDNDGNDQFTLEGIAAEVREDGNQQGSIAISTARRLLRFIWGPRSSDEDDTYEPETRQETPVIDSHVNEESILPRIESTDENEEITSDLASSDRNSVTRPEDETNS